MSFLNLTNSIAVGAIVTDQGYTNSVATSATLSTLQGLGVTKSFSPDVIGVGQTARLRFRLISTLDPNAATLRTLTGVSYTDNLPDGMFVDVTPDISTDCVGSGTGGKPVIATSNDTASGQITVTEATIAPGSNCLIELNVRVNALGAYNNIIPAREVVSDQGVLNESEVQATLKVVTSPTLVKAFAHSIRNPGQPNRLTVTINNNDPTLTLTNVALTDTLPAGLAIANPANAATTCSNGQVIASPGESFLRLIDATLAPGSSCTFSADVVGNATGEYINVIGAGALTSDQGLTNTGTAQATMNVGAPPTIAKAFDPVGIAPGGTATLTITLTNPNAAAITLTEPLLDALPGNLFVAVADPPNPSTTCTPGELTADAGATSISLAAGAQIPGGIPGGGSCTINVNVTTSVEGVYTNVIAAGQLQTTTGSNPSPATASLAVAQQNPLAPPTVTKAFSPGTIMAGGTSTLTLSLGNPNDSALTLIADFIDILPSGVVIADPASVAGNCATGSVTATAGSDSITYASGAMIPAGGCTITVPVTSNTGGSYTNSIPVGALATTGGANLIPATAGLVVQTPTPPTLTKAFSPNTINPGDVARLTISLGNANASAITLSADLEDNLPPGVTVGAKPNVGGTCTIGSVTATAGSDSITYASGAEIPPGGCTIAVDVTASDSTGSPFVNTIPAGALQTDAGDNGAPATANLFVNPPQPPSLSKFFSPSTILVGSTARLTLSFGNGNLAGTTLTADLVDTLPAGVVIASPPDIQTSTGCDPNKVQATAGGNTLTYQTDGPIPVGGCSISVVVTSTVVNNTGHLNSIPAGALQTGFGVSAVGTSARLRVTGLGVLKAVDGPSGPYAIGDEITYQLSVTVPGGVTADGPVLVNNLTLTDTLPAGVGYVSGSYILEDVGGLVFDNPAPADFTESDNSLSINLGTVRNTTGTDRTFVVSYRVQVLNVPSNLTGTNLTNSVTVSSSDTGSTWGDTATATVGEPSLVITKGMMPSTNLKAGDLVTVTLTVTNNGNVPAFAVAVTDILNEGTGNDNALFALAASGISDTSTGAGADDFDFDYDEATGTITYTAKDGVSLAANGGAVIFSFTAPVAADIRTGWTYSNQASAAGNSQNDPTIGRPTPEVDSNTATVNTGAAAVTKAIAATSEDWTTGSQVAIGEVITYRLSYSIPVGETISPNDAAIFADTLPAGQQFLTDTATISASAAGVIIADGSQVTDVGNGEALPTSATAIAPTIAGQQLGFNVGTVQNTGTAAAQVIIEFDALVLNNTDNNHDNTKTNTATLNYVNRDGNTQSQTATQQTRIVEPLPAVTKTASPTTAGGGDTVTFEVVASAATGTNRTRLWDVVVTDTLPARYLSPTLTSAVLSRGNVNVTTCGSFAVQTLTLSMDCLDADERYLAPGQTITLTYTATLDPNIAFEEVVTNTAQVQGTSLPGSNGTNDAAPGDPGSDTGERTGSNALNTSGQAVNDLNASDNATLTANKPSLTKVVADDSLPIGAITTATITVSVPVGQTEDFVVTDTLPTGLRFTGGAIGIALPANLTASNTPTAPVAGNNPLEFDFGTVQNSAATSQNIVITYPVQVENVIGNQRDTQLTNTAVLTYSGASEPFPADSATITVREPALALSKTITAGTPAVAGSEVSYQLTVSNADGFATAYRMDLTDVLPADLLGANDSNGPYFTDVQVINPGDAVVKSAGGVLIAADADQTTATDTLAWPLFDLPPNTTLTISYKATVVDGAVTGATLTNEVEAAYNSLATGTDGRDGSDVLDDTDPNALNNYGQTTSRALTLDKGIALQKTLSTGEPLDASYAIGEEVLFDVKVSLLAGVTNNVVVTDTLPAGLQFIELVSIIADQGISFSGLGTAVENPTGTVTVDLGNVTIPPTVTDKSLTLRLKARVRNIATNQNGVVLTNNAEVTSAIGVATASQEITVVEPVLQVTKTPDTTVPALGNLVTYSVVVSHAPGSNADAYQVAFTDLIPAGMTYQTGSTSGQASVDESDSTALVFSLDQIANGESKTFSYQAKVDLDAVVGSALQNLLSGSFTSTANADGASNSGRTGPLNDEDTLNDYVFGTSAAVTPTTTAFLYPVKTVALVVDGGDNGQVDPGDTLEYTIVLNNEGDDATGVVFTDPIPTHTTYVAASATLNGSPAGAVTDDLLTITIGNLAANATATITFRVTVDSGTAPGTVISNQGSVDSDQTVPTPTDADGVRDNGFQPTEIPVGGQPIVQSPLYAEKRVVLLTDQNGNGVVNPGDTLRYSLVLSNLGDQPLTNVALTDNIPTGLTYVNGTASASDGSASVNGQSLDWTLNQLAAGDFQLLVFNVTVDTPLVGGGSEATFTNQGTTDSDETLPGLTDSNGDPSDGFQPTLIDATTGSSGAPRLDVQKRWSLAQDLNGNGLANPGDVVGYSISVTNSGSAATIDARLTDAIPTNTTLVAGSVTTDRGVVTGTSPVAVNLGSLLSGEVATVRFQVTIDSGVPDGTLIANQANVTGNNFDPVLSDDNGNPADGLNPTLTPVVTDDPSVATPGGLTKTLSATSESASIGADVLIGEVVTYQVGVQVPPGTLRDALIEDVLPAGLGYLPGTAKLSRTFSIGLNASQNPGDINAAASGDFVDLIDGIELKQDDQTLRLLLGDVINSDGTAASYTLEYQAVVRNVATNLAGQSLPNQATLRWLNALNQPASLTPVTQTLTVLEPALTITKVADPKVIRPDGQTTFTLTLTHPANGHRAPAYDVLLTDLFGAWDSIDPASITLTASGGVDDVDSSGTTSERLEVTIGTFPVGGQLLVTVTANVVAEAGDDIDNIANLTWTSLPGDRGTDDATPGEPGSETGERTGSGGTNGYAASDSERVRAVAVDFDKSIDNTQTRYAIGDPIDYRITVTLPPGLADGGQVILDNSIITDVLDAGLVYVTGSLTATLQDGDITADPSPLPADFTVAANSPGVGQTTLTLDVGTLANANTTDARTLELTYKARVANVLGNQNNQLLDNAARIDFNLRGNPTEQLSDATQVQVGEPNLTLVKTITTATTGLDAGSVVGFQVVVSNNGTTTAFDTVLSDTLPTGLQDVTGLQVSATSGGAQAPTFSTHTDGDQAFTSDPFDLPVGSSVTLIFSATLSDQVVPGQTLQNQVLADFSSRSGGDPNQRDGSDEGDQTDPSVLNNYNTQAKSPIITVDVPVTLDKAFHPDPARTSYTIGEEIQYRLTLGIIEGVTRAVSIVDELPAGVSFLSAAVGLGNTGIVTGKSTGPNDQPTRVDGTNLIGQTLTFELGDVSNPANANPYDDVITIDIRVRVDNLAANQAGTLLSNNAHALYTDFDDQVQRVDFDADADEDGSQPLVANLVEPVLDLTKTTDRTRVALGTEVVFTLTIAHMVDSGADAHDLVLVDTLPPGLIYVAGSATPVQPSVSGDSSTGQVLTFDRGSLSTASGQTQVTLRALAEPGLVVDQTLTNRARLTWSSLPEATGEADSGRTGPLNETDSLNDYVSTSSAEVTPNADNFLYPVKTVALVVDGGETGQVDPDDTLEYTIVVTNQGDNATGVVFTDPIPTHTSYVADSATLNGSTAGAVTDDVLTITIGDLATDATATITFRVIVDSGTAAGTVISNQGAVDSDQTVPTPTDADGVRDNGFQPTEIPVGGQPSLQSPLYAEKRVVLLTDQNGNGVVNPGDTLRYSLVLSNLGDQPLTNVALTDNIPTGLTYVNDSASASGGTTSVTGQSMTWTVPMLAAGDFEILVFNVTVNSPLPDNASDATFVNQGTTDSDETPPGLTDGNGDPSDGFQPTEIDATTGSGAPRLDVQKRWSLAQDQQGNGLVNPGDVIGYSLSVTNSGSAAATDVRLSDAIPANTSLMAGSVISSQGAVVSTGDPIEVNLGILDAGAVATISFQVRVNGATPDGTIIANQATVTRTGDATGVKSDDNGNPADGLNPTLTPVVTDDDPSVGLTKTLHATSESGSTGTGVLIGEVATFQVTVAMPAGTLRQATLSDHLPAGLNYLPGTARLARTFDTGLNAKLDPGGINSANSGVFVALTDDSELVIDGQRLSLALGDVINSDSDPDDETYALDETYTLEYQVLVANVAPNQAGTALSNSANLSYLDALGQPRDLTPVTQALTLIEPAVQIDKSVSPSVVSKLGGEVTFTLILTNPIGVNGATAYDVQVLDELPDAFTTLQVVQLTATGGVLGDSDHTVGAVLDVSVATLPPGESLTLTYQATLPAGPLEQITNTAKTTWTSLPGARGTNNATPGNPGTENGERTGSAMGPNDYFTQDSAVVWLGGVALGDRVWHDTNRNGIQDPDEPGIAGVTVELYDGTGTLLRTTQTDGSGAYAFDQLEPGTYRVTFIAPSGYSFTEPNQTGSLNVLAGAFDSDAIPESGDPNVGQTSLIILTGDDPTIDAGLYLISSDVPASIGDRVWYDTDGNGFQGDDEPGVAGVTVELYDSTDNALIATTVTDGSGFYEFAGLPEGSYVVEFVLPDTSWEFSPRYATDPDNDSDADGSGRTDLILLTAGTNLTDIDAGIRILNVAPATIGDRVWYDTDGKGIQDAGEPGIPGVVVNLYDATGGFIATVKTDANGNYAFTGLPAGDYLVQFELPVGYDRFSGQSLGEDDTRDSDPDPLTGLVSVRVLEDEIRTDIDAGMFIANESGNPLPPIRLGDYVWLDTNGNEEPDASEWLDGVEVVLYDALGRELARAITDAFFFDPQDPEANYLFTGVGQGSYRVAIDTSTLPAAVIQIADPDQIADPAAQLDHETELLGQTVDNLEVDFGYARVPPVAKDDEDLDNDVGSSVTIEVLDNDEAAEGRTLKPETVQIVGTAAAGDPLIVEGEGTWTVDTATGDITFTPLPDFTGNPTPIAYLVRDDAGAASNAATVRVTYVIAANIVRLCDSNTPYVEYEILSEQTGSMTIQWYDLLPSGERGAPNGEPLLEQPRAGRLLWPGAVVNEDGEIDTWPGWELIDNEWVRTNPEAQTIKEIEFSINPTISVLVQYPDPSASCRPYPPTPVANDDVSLGNPLGNPVTLSVLTNDVPLDERPFVPGTVQILGTAEPGNPLEVEGEGTWRVVVDELDDSVEITFTPLLGFPGNPTPIQYLVTDSQGATSNPATVTITYEGGAYLTLLKEVADAPSKIGVGSRITYRITATNTGARELTGVMISDDLPGLSKLTCTQPATLQPGASLSCTATYIVRQADVSDGGIDNTAVVQATTPSTTGGDWVLSRESSVTLPIIRQPRPEPIPALAAVGLLFLICALGLLGAAGARRRMR